MLTKNLELATRSIEFTSVVDKTICTDIHGQLQDTEKSINQLITQLSDNREFGNKVYLIGNGGSAGVVSHALTDFLNVCRLRAFSLHESSLLTCMSNDFGYENAFARIVKTVIRPGDILIAISSSGKSKNICNAVKTATEMGSVVVTLSGFNSDNPLRKLGDLNFWLNSSDYGLVEIGHLFILHNISDRIGQEMKKTQSISMNTTTELL